MEIVLHLLGVAPLLVAPGSFLEQWPALPDAEPRALVLACAAIAAVAGFVLIWLALSPGRRPRHQLGAGPHAIVVDNGVIASAAAARIRRELDLSRNAVVVGVGHRAADVTVRPDAGRTIDRAEVRALAESELSGYGLSPEVKVRARVVRTADAEGAS
ncbi:hypothetical protein FM112_07455 [Gulosibacter sp. 10]|nr:hypothetical protein FM112_07455 [Gulosibacter sp. 10]